MDCSGTIYYLLKQAGFDDVPRQANEQYEWVRQKSHFYAVLSKKQDNVELREMRPGDLLFWEGTYHVDRDPPVTHVMVYLGKRKKDGVRLMFGSSDGRPYDGQRRNGVSVFDFKMPAARSGDAADAATAAAPDHAPDFSGYGPVPGMTDLSDIASRQTTGAKGTPSSTGSDAGAKKDADADDDDACAQKSAPQTTLDRRIVRGGGHLRLHVFQHLVFVAVGGPDVAQEIRRVQVVFAEEIAVARAAVHQVGGISPRSLASAFLMMRGSHGMPPSRASLAGRSSMETVCRRAVPCWIVRK